MTKKLVGTALFSALAFVVSLLEFPIFPAAGFLQMDFSAVFILLSGFAFGAVYGVATCAVKELIRFAIGSGTGGVGEIANFIIICGFILLPTIVYHYRKGIKTVILTLAVGCLIQIGLSLLSNRFIMFPLYMGEGAATVFQSLWWYVALFNLIKSVSVSLVTILLYKRVSWVIKKI